MILRADQIELSGAPDVAAAPPGREMLRVLAAAAAVFTLLVLRLLLTDVMGERLWNEADVLPLARQAVDGDWVRNDWYLSQPAGYRGAFNEVAGRLVLAVGFGPAALVGRLACYALVAVGVATIGRAIGLRPTALVLAAAAFFAADGRQGAAAGEWAAGGFEAKAVAWGLVLLAVGLALGRRLPAAGLLAGLATTAHVLVGGWAAGCLAAWVAWQKWGRREPLRPQDLIAAAVLAALGGAAGAWQVVAHLTAPKPPDAAAADFLYVFARLPHHLGPFTWGADEWGRLAAFGLAAGAALLGLRWMSATGAAEACVGIGVGVGDGDGPPPASGRLDPRGPSDLAGFTLVSLVPFAAGLAVAPFDADGRWLKYYPFRLGDLMLPLAASLLAARAVQQYAARARRPLWRQAAFAAAAGLLAFVFVGDAWRFGQRLGPTVRAIRSDDDPGDDAWAQVCRAVRERTPAGAVVVAPPTAGADFTRRSRRATVANFKLLPQTPTGVLEWRDRLSALSPGVDLTALARERGYEADVGRWALADGYDRLTTNQARAVMARFGARHLVSAAWHDLDLPVVYRNERYALYADGEPATADWPRSSRHR